MRQVSGNDWNEQKRALAWFGRGVACVGAGCIGCSRKIRCVSAMWGLHEQRGMGRKNRNWFFLCCPKLERSAWRWTFHFSAGSVSPPTRPASCLLASALPLFATQHCAPWRHDYRLTKPAKGSSTGWSSRMSRNLHVPLRRQSSCSPVCRPRASRLSPALAPQDISGLIVTS